MIAFTLLVSGDDGVNWQLWLHKQIKGFSCVRDKWGWWGVKGATLAWDKTSPLSSGNMRQHLFVPISLEPETRQAILAPVDLTVDLFTTQQ